VGLSALGLRSAVDDLGSAVPVGKGQAQYSRRHRGAVVQAAGAQRETESESPTLRQSGSGGLTARTEKEIADETFGLCSGRPRNGVRWLSRARRLRPGAVRGRLVPDLVGRRRHAMGRRLGKIAIGMPDWLTASAALSSARSQGVCR